MKIKIKYHPAKGFVLITVLFIIALLTALLVEFNYASRTSVHQADNFRARLQALYCARAGLQIAIAVINQNPDIQTNETLRKMLSDNKQIDIDSGQCHITILDENGKLNLNHLKTGVNQFDKIRVDQVLRLLDHLNSQYSTEVPFSYSLVPAVIDWTDKDDLITMLPHVSHHNMGVESAWYENESRIGFCKNKPLQTVNELLLVKDVTPFHLYGDSMSNHNRPDPRPGLEQFVTVYGNGLININTAPRLVIQSLADFMDPALTEIILNRRQLQPFASLDELVRLPGLSLARISILKQYLTTKPDEYYYKITARGKVDSGIITIEAVIKKTLNREAEIILYHEI
ncbi:MAG: general secretion pathway protein GspK [Sedimentisphaerales bacterium]|nr:general secretion pathway protein GspK [Sedimentisphaerales bacterium]